MCHTGCADNSIAVYDIPKCAGLCDPVKGFRDAAAYDEADVAKPIPPGGPGL